MPREETKTKKCDCCGHLTHTSTHLLVVKQVRRVDLLLGAVAERVDEVALVGPHAFGRAPHNVHISVSEEPLATEGSEGGLSELL